jgi:hypothetical protein
MNPVSQQRAEARPDDAAPAFDPAMRAHIDELLNMRVEHLPAVACSGPWRLQTLSRASRVAGATGQALDAFVPEGLYAALYEHTECGGDRLWMSDIPPEVWTMGEALKRFEDPGTQRVLLSGLALGVLVQHALRQPQMRRVDVIERDAAVIRLSRSYFRDSRRRLRVSHADALHWPIGRRRTWDYAYHDIWPRICVSNLVDMLHLEARYRAHVGAQDFWQRAQSERLLRQAVVQGKFDAEVLVQYMEVTGRPV